MGSAMSNRDAAQVVTFDLTPKGPEQCIALAQVHALLAIHEQLERIGDHLEDPPTFGPLDRIADVLDEANADLNGEVK